MPVLAASDKTDFLRRQVLTSRNVRGGWLTDFAMGGLNYQIEHHLFPSMPRPRPVPVPGAGQRDHLIDPAGESGPRAGERPAHLVLGHRPARH
jgi:hypothetical protein